MEPRESRIATAASEATQTIAIVGVGLIGGSLALALKDNTPHVVIGIDRDERVLQAALAVGAVDRTGVEELPAADIVVIALAPADTVAFLQQYAGRLRPGTLVTDVCGVKRTIVQRCEPLCRAHGLIFVGGHPMAGREKGGFANAVSTLFRGASYILTPTDDTPEDAVHRLRELALSLGCERVTLAAPDEHDAMIAFTSQLPHVLAGAYVKLPRCPQHLGFSAGSYRDVSRVATVDERLWTQLFLHNADHLCDEIDGLIQRLQQCRDAVAQGDAERLQIILREGRERKESVTE